jgi:hypothetical protein
MQGFYRTYDPNSSSRSAKFAGIGELGGVGDPDPSQLRGVVETIALGETL